MAASLLKPGGRFVVLVTNLRSIQARRFCQDDYPRHLTIFTAAALERLYARYGLRIIRGSTRQDIFGGALNGGLVYACKRLTGYARDEAMREWKQPHDPHLFWARWRGRPSRLHSLVEQGRPIADESARAAAGPLGIRIQPDRRRGEKTLTDRWVEYFERQGGLDARWLKAAVAHWSFHEILYGMIERHCPPPARILDVGRGPGWSDLYLSSAGYDVTGVDHEPRLVAHARDLGDLCTAIDCEARSAHGTAV